MITTWKCADCAHANTSDDDAACYWCGGHQRRAVYPVREPNMQQGTPSYDDLLATIEREEANRATDQSIEQQIEELLAQHRQEMGDGKLRDALFAYQQEIAHGCPIDQDT